MIRIKMRTKTTALLLALLLFYCGNVNAQDNLKKIDNWLADNAPAMGGRDILLIYKDGHIIYSHAENKMNMRQKILNRYVAKRQGETPDLGDYTLNTRQAIASCSKWLSAALIMTFVDEGKLKLTDTVGKYLPVLTRHGKGNITIADCLAHLTAVKSPELKEEMHDLKNMNTMDDAIGAIADLSMEGEPGKVFHYSNTGLQIAAAVIEKISDDNFRHLFTERIAKPLNMDHPE